MAPTRSVIERLLWLRIWLPFSRIHPALPLLFWCPLIVVSAYHALVPGGLGLVEALGAGLLGGFIWTLSEYIIHRPLLHLRGGPLWMRLNWLLHGVHHQRPADPYQTVFPPWIALPFSALAAGGFLLLLPQPLAVATWCGYTVAYGYSDWTHWAVHHREPWTAIGRAARRRHLSHHFVDCRRGYGVTTGLWDHVFGTVAALIPDEGCIEQWLMRASGPYDSERSPGSTGYPQQQPAIDR